MEYDSIMQVFYNLLGNAVKFCNKGTITLSVVEDGDDVLMSVEDTGSDSNLNMPALSFPLGGNGGMINWYVQASAYLQTSTVKSLSPSSKLTRLTRGSSEASGWVWLCRSQS